MNTFKHLAFGLTLALALFTAMPTMAAEGSEAKDPAAAEAAADRTGDPYPLAVCATSGEPLGSMGKPPVRVIEGREVRFCCAGCVRGFENNPAHAQEVDKKISENQNAHYPLDTCINTGAALGDSPVTFVAGNRIFKTCCNNCKAAVEGDVAGFVEKLDKAVAEKLKESYPLDKDIATGEALTDDAVDYVIANRLFRVNGEASIEKINTNPAKFIAKLDEARN